MIKIYKLVKSGQIKNNEYKVYSIGNNALIQVKENFNVIEYCGIKVEKIKSIKM